MVLLEATVFVVVDFVVVVVDIIIVIVVDFNVAALFVVTDNIIFSCFE